MVYYGEKRAALRIVLAAVIVMAGLTAFVCSLDLVLDQYPAEIRVKSPQVSAQASAQASDQAGKGSKRKSGSKPSPKPKGEPALTARVVDDRSAAVIAVMTPMIAGIAAILGLYFGISATGSKRGQEREAELLKLEKDLNKT